MKKIILIIIAALAIIAFFALDIDQLLTLEQIQSSQTQIEQWRSESPLLTAGFFALAYILVTALSLPGAAIMTLAAGAFFGLLLGTLLVSFASSIGATLAFLAARYLLRDSVQNKFSDRLQAINKGIEREGAFYLFTLRLVPIFPFFIINLVMGLTPIKAKTFYWVSQIGMLAGTIVYVNAGTQLARIDSVSGILSLPLVISFALLGVFPLLAKQVIQWLQRRKVYQGYTKPSSFDRNLIVIGGGAAGLVASYIGATVKAKVTLVEAHKMGGDCLNYGCVPSKALIKSAKQAQQIRQGDRYGLEPMTPQFSFRSVMQRVQDVIGAVAPHDSVERYTKLGVEVLLGYATLTDPWTVSIALETGKTQVLTTKAIIIAAGAEPFIPPIPGLAETGYLTSDTLWESFAQMDTAPKRLVILGGGPIGCELAQAFSRLGSGVTQIEMLPRMMIREDEEVSLVAETALKKDGVEVLTNHKALRFERDSDQQYIVVLFEGAEKRIPFDALICAVGRSARLTGYGLESLGIPTDRSVITNEYLETLYPNIFAAGDVAGPFQFTHTAGHQAWYATVNALFGTFKRFKADYSIIPWTTFIDPEVARVGLNEREAKEKGISYEVTRFNLEELDRAIADSATQGFIKILTVPGKDRILGVTIVGEHGGDLLTEFVLAMKHGLGLNKILSTIHTYPTFGEANKYAAGAWKRNHAPQKVLALMSTYHNWQRR